MKVKLDVYLVNVTILEGRHYAWPNMDSYVHVRVGNKKKCTKIVRSTDCPFYNEYFVFQFETDLQSLIDKTITLTVIRPRTCWRKRKMLGYCSLDLATIWSQPGHLFYQKWAIMSARTAEFLGPRGYLKVTLCITTKGEHAKIPLTHPDINEEIEGNLLLPEGITVQRRKAVFLFKVYKGEDVIKFKSFPKKTSALPQTQKKDLPSSVVAITFAGITATTTIQKNTSTPVWNEMLAIGELFPPLCQRVKVSLKITNSTLIGVKYLNLYSIANDQVDGFLPTFGPTFIHFYNRDKFGEVYIGKVLMSLHTQLQNVTIHGKTGLRKPIMPINENSLYKYEPVLLFGAIMGVSGIDRRFSKKPINFQISIGNPNIQQPIDPAGEGCPLNITQPYIPKATNQLHWYLDFEDQIPCFSFQNTFPDSRRRFYNANMIRKLCAGFKSRLDEIEPFFQYERLRIPSDIIEAKLLKTLDLLGVECRKYIDMVQPTLDKHVTQLDREKLKLCIREMEDIESLARTIYNPKTKKKSFRKAQKLYQRLVLLIDHPQECWPDVIIHMCYNNKRVSTFSAKSDTIIFSLVEEEAGEHCGKSQQLLLQTPLRLKTMQKTTTACIMDVILWIGLRRHMDFCFHSLPDCFIFPNKTKGSSVVPRCLLNPERHIFQCRAHIYQGNLKFGADSTGLADLFARVTLKNSGACTKAQKGMLNPLWNETIVLTNIILYGSKECLKHQPPIIVIEVIDHDDMRFRDDFMGRALAKPHVKLKDEPYGQPEFPPKLQWYDIRKGGSLVGSILACVELLEMPELEELARKKSKKHITSIPDDIKPKLAGYKIDVLFWGLRQLKKLHGMSITKAKITLDCTMASLDSEVVPKRESNFPSYQKELIVRLPEEEKYVPAISLKLFDSRALGKFTYVANHAAHVQHFMVYPLTREEREFMLRQPLRTSIDSMDSRAASFDKNPPVQPQMTSVATQFDVENERTGCCGFCKRLCKKRKRDDEEETPLVTQKDDILIEEDEFTNWWNKYFLSLESKSHCHLDADESRPKVNQKFRLKIYNEELENQPEFRGLQDMLISFNLIRGERTGEEEVDEKNIMGVFKGNVKVYPWPPHKDAEYVTYSGLPLTDGYFQDYPLNDHVSFLARLYCVKGIKLRPRDSNGKSDPFLVAFMGNQYYNDSKNYIPKQINPTFGKCFEFSGTFPHDSILTVQVWDWDRTTKHDLIGETRIDLENRYYTKHRARCGLPYEYTEVGYTPWRDILNPCEILDNICKKANIGQPKYFDTYVSIGHFIFAPELEEGEQPQPVYNKYDLALTALHRWHQVPVVGYHLVPEHVETRSLYHRNHPGLEQGKLQLWVDIFPVHDLPAPRAVDITPQPPTKYELRIIIWNTEDVILEEDDFFVGEKKSDIYVKGWLADIDQAQTTDVHYRSLDGEGNFNWRFIFPFSYLKTEDKIVLLKKESVFDRTPTENKIPCMLKLQVWDNDTFSADDFLGSLSFHLNRMPRGARTSRKCSLQLLEPQAPHINLFRVKRLKGWWPFRSIDQEKNEYILAGKLEAEFNLLTEDEAAASPAGLGRSEPNPLPKPNRPDTSFSFFKNPFKLLKYLICKHYRWRIIFCVLFTFMALSIAFAIWRFPELTIRKVLNLLPDI